MNEEGFSVSGNFVDLFQRRIYPAEVVVKNRKIASVKELTNAPEQYILPGFVDAHVHIESSMLIPSAFAQLAVVHGTVATVSDPHEIANVCGIEGIDFMVANSRQTDFKFFFGAPSCVPATSFETAGARIDADAIEKLMYRDDIWYLAEMMNYPGVLQQDEQVMKKIAAAKKAGKPIDGHAPGLKGEWAERYAAAGITTDHESFSLEEGLDKVKFGMYCLIREGSAAKNFEALIDIIRTNPYAVMFCSDDKHPDELVLHHINNHVKRAIDKGFDLFDVLRAASVNPVVHYNLPVGLLRVGDPADFIVVNNLTEFKVLQSYISGKRVAENGVSFLPSPKITPINNFLADSITIGDLQLTALENLKEIRVINAIDGQLITQELLASPKIENGYLISNTDEDILKICVVNRYEKKAPPAVAFIKNFGIKKGAIASTVAHDCHNIVAVGTDDASLTAAINQLITVKGGIAVALHEEDVRYMALPIAGLMTDKDGYEVAREYSFLDTLVKTELGSTLQAPFMTLSFMALLVIPALKLSDKGLFNGKDFQFTEVQIKA